MERPLRHVATFIGKNGRRVIQIKGLSPGVHKFQCCIHPWMRAVVDVEDRK
jgi:hypothetical protein